MTELFQTLRDPEAERRLILSVALEPSLLQHARQVSQSDFGVIENGVQWGKLTGAIKNGRAVYLSEILPGASVEEVTPLAPFVQHDAEIVTRLSACRRAVLFAQNVARCASRQEVDAIKQAVLDFKLYSASASTIVPAGHDLERAIKSVVDYESVERFPLGVPGMDEKVNLERQTLSLIMARPSMGKTALLLQIADKVSERGAKAIFFQKEMSLESMQRRIAVRRARVSIKALKRNTATPDDRQRCAEELMKLYERSTLWFDCSVPQTSDSVLAQCEQFADEHGSPDLIICDHGALFCDEAKDEVRRLDVIYRNMKNLAKRLDSRVILASQLNRAVEAQGDKRPDLKDLRGSGTIEEHADSVYGLYRERYYTPTADHVAEIIACKQRDGERNERYRSYFNEEFMSFEPLDERTVHL